MYHTSKISYHQLFSDSSSPHHPMRTRETRKSFKFNGYMIMMQTIFIFFLFQRVLASEMNVMVSGPVVENVSSTSSPSTSSSPGSPAETRITSSDSFNTLGLEPDYDNLSSGSKADESNITSIPSDDNIISTIGDRTVSTLLNSPRRGVAAPRERLSSTPSWREFLHHSCLFLPLNSKNVRQ